MLFEGLKPPLYLPYASEMKNAGTVSYANRYKICGLDGNVFLCKTNKQKYNCLFAITVKSSFHLYLLTDQAWLFGVKLHYIFIASLL